MHDKEYIQVSTWPKKKKNDSVDEIAHTPAFCEVAPIIKSALSQWPLQPELIQWHEGTRKVFLLPSGWVASPPAGQLTQALKLIPRRPQARSWVCVRVCHFISQGKEEIQTLLNVLIISG